MLTRFGYLLDNFFLKALMLCKNTPLKIQGLNLNHKLLLFLEKSTLRYAVVTIENLKTTTICT